MADVHLTRHVLNRPKDLMALVADVESYPEFINLLSALRVRNREKISDDLERFEADATVSYKFISETFSSIVNLHHDENRISVTKANRSGALRTLRNVWKFHELSDGSTLVDFDIEVKLKAFPLEMLLREKFDLLGEHMMTLFQTKARQTCPKVGREDLDLKTEYARLGLSDLFQEDVQSRGNRA